MIIYRAVNKLNGMTYIGQTVNSLKKRIGDHKSCSKTYFGKSLRKYGIDEFHLEVLDTAKTLDELNDKEEYYIGYFNTIYPNGYNHKAGGNNHKMTADAIKRGADKQRGRKSSPETKEKQRLLRLKKVKRICVKTNEEKIYNSIKETKLDGFEPRNVSFCAKFADVNLTHRGYYWNYVDPTHSRSSRKSIPGLKNIGINLIKDGTVYSFSSLIDAANFVGCYDASISSLNNGRIKSIKGYKKC